MLPQYSMLLLNQDLKDYHDKIRTWLFDGIKVFWIGNSISNDSLNEEFFRFSEAKLLLCYEGSNLIVKGEIIDGNDVNNLLPKIEDNIPTFNIEQYRVEHCSANSHVVVEASAGTGKTTVMIDRIMFMLHTIPNIKLSDIAMITFTNEATAQMSRRLQSVLLNRFKATSNPKYLNWLEQQAEMQISTIDSFSLSLLKSCGTVGGFSQQVKVKTLNYERKELIKDIIDDLVNNKSSVSKQLGLSYYKATALADTFWNRIAQLGLVPDTVLNLDWGIGNNDDSNSFQDAFQNIISELIIKYANLKQSNDSVTLLDLKRDINMILPEAIRKKAISNVTFKYLFVDEFQDSDNSQIFLLGKLVTELGLNLFVVGDIKQSIYRFRGAVDSAFNRLKIQLCKDNNQSISFFELTNNYRTAPSVIREFEKCFVNWSEDKLLPKAKSVSPCSTSNGTFHIIRSTKKGLDERLFIDEIKSLVNDFKNRFEKNKLTQDSRNRVVVLTRTNRQVSSVAKILDKYHIPAVAKRDGAFYQSEAVKDFYAFISSFYYQSEPIYLFNYLISSFSEVTPDFDIVELKSCQGDNEELLLYLNPFLLKTSWYYYSDLLKEKPVLSVIKEVMEKVPFLDNYISRRKVQKEKLGWNENEIIESVHAEALQYKANMDKLIEILHEAFKGDSVTVNKITSYLSNMIATNREENEADIEEFYSSNCVYCMTVHKAKGLEFDTVILPITDTPFFYKNQTEILINNKQTRIAWNISSKESDKELHNKYYYEVRREEDYNATSEETRILYVAMTRTIHSFSCILSKTQDENCWTGLFEKVGTFDE